MTSPYNLIQEQLANQDHYVWRILVACMLLNRTDGAQVRPMIEALFKLAPSPKRMVVVCDYDKERLLRLLRPLGLYNRRMAMLRKLSQAYVDEFDEIGEPRYVRKDGRWASHMPGCGQYAVDSLNIFVYGILENASSDTWLQKYIEWRKSK